MILLLLPSVTTRADAVDWDILLGVTCFCSVTLTVSHISLASTTALITVKSSSTSLTSLTDTREICSLTSAGSFDMITGIRKLSCCVALMPSDYNPRTFANTLS